MNVIWSSRVQGVRTLYHSRKLRFHDLFRQRYEPLFDLDGDRRLKILEVGCGPGALAGALRRWYPKAEITALDRDSEFIRFAREHEPGVRFLEGDAASLPFGDGAFDVTISNTVSEHIEPGVFFGEQRRVLRPGGVCLVLSSRRGISVPAACLALGEEEKRFWDRAAQADDTFEKYAVGRYHMSEAELPAAMERYGFADVRTGYAAIGLTPDDPAFSPELAREMIDAERYGQLEAIASTAWLERGDITDRDRERMETLANARYDARQRQYDRGERQWDTEVSLIMVVRGTA